MTDPRARIPSVDALLAADPFRPLLEAYPRARVVDAVRASVDEMRARISGGDAAAEVDDEGTYAAMAQERLTLADRPSLRPVINATGVVLHTNLGRAPLARVAVEAMRAAVAYSNLEYDLESGSRGSRYVHCVSLLTELTGAEDAVVVNNAAGALVLALNTLARHRGVAVSRGELVEIGGGFRIPEVLERAGSELVEVGSTNRTRASDYTAALAKGRVAALLKVHRSNFRISGFTEEASLAELAELAAGHDLPLVHDLGSGLMVEAERLGLPDEPRAVQSLGAGADIVVVSGDKLLGGPQAGIVLGRGDLVAAMRRNPLCRALRVDKVTLAGLEATLRLYRDPERAVREIPALRMLAAPVTEVEARAEALAGALAGHGVAAHVVAVRGAVGGGTFPGTELDSRAVALDGAPEAWAATLRQGSPPVVGRIVDDVFLLDVRTVLDAEVDTLVASIVAALSTVRGAD